MLMIATTSHENTMQQSHLFSRAGLKDTPPFFLMVVDQFMMLILDFFDDVHFLLLHRDFTFRWRALNVVNTFSPHLVCRLLDFTFASA
jgi:hypothetical protein